MQRTALAGCTALLALGAAIGCQPSEIPDLLSIYRIDPHRASAGDRVAITGEGFPDARPAQVTFRGTLFRPGASPERDVRVVLSAEPLTRNAIVVPFDAKLERRFVGRGDGALHTTFQGDVRVTFEPEARGRTEISGTAHGVTFDVLPTNDGASDADRAAEGSNTLAFLGVNGAMEPMGNGLRVTALDPEGRAAQGGVRKGDLIRRFDGVTVLSLSDMRARTGEKIGNVVVERDGRALPELAVDVDGAAPFGVGALEGAAALLVVVAFALAIPATALGAALKWLLRLAAGTNATKAGHARAPLPKILDGITPSGIRGALFAVLVATFALTALGLTALSTGHSLVSPESDLAVLVFATWLPLFVVRFAAAGIRKNKKSFSFRRAFVALSRSFLLFAPQAIAVFGAVLASGRFVVGEIVGGQGGAPLRFGALENPGLLVLLLSMIGSAVPETADLGALGHAEGAPRAAGTTTALRETVRVVEAVSLWLTATLAVLLFLGGYRLPNVFGLAAESSRATVLAGVAVCLAKIVGVVVFVGFVRRFTARVSIEHVAALWARWVVPISVVALIAAALWATLLEASPSSSLGSIAAFAELSFGALVVSLFAMVTFRAPGESANVNPWI